MPLPLPDLDTRTWNDLVDEGRALIPRYARGWTDFNYHDPGISIVELLAWLVEQDIYWINRVPPAHRLAFLALAGFRPQPPQPTTALLALTPGADIDVPPGVQWTVAAAGIQPLIWTNAHPLHAAATHLVAVWTQTGAGERPVNMTQAWSQGAPFALLGRDPQGGAALYLGFDTPLPAGQPIQLGLQLIGGRSGPEERQRLAAEMAAQAAACARRSRPNPCAPADAQPSTGQPSAPKPLQHHSVRLTWSYYTLTGDWRLLDAAAGEIVDETRSLTLDGQIMLNLPGPMGTGGVSGSAAFYLRVQVEAGDYDAPPKAAVLALNALPLSQVTAPSSVFTIAPGVVAGGPHPIAPGLLGLDLRFGADGSIISLATSDAEGAARLRVFYYLPATALTEGQLVVDLIQIGRSSGEAEQEFRLPQAVVAGDAAQVFSDEGSALHAWRSVPDFGASGGRDYDAVIDHAAASVRLGDGDHGHIPPLGAAIFAQYEATGGKDGDIRTEHAVTLAPSLQNWLLLDPDDYRTQASAAAVRPDVAWVQASPASYAAAAAKLGVLPHLQGVRAGADAESINHAAGRATLTLQQPTRAVTAADYESLATNTPGATIARVKALPGRIAGYPCLSAPGVVTVIVVPAQERARPLPSAGLLDAVHDFLNRRRLVGSHLAVVAPSYVEVQVTATVKMLVGASPDVVRAAVLAALQAFLHPLTGGPAAIRPPARTAGRTAAQSAQPRTTPGLIVAASAMAVETVTPATTAPQPGWPFGRDVYRSEVLQVIDGVPGVDHVLSLSLSADGALPECGNVCLGPTQLVVSGRHQIEVV